MSTLSRSIITGLLVALGIAFVLWSGIEYPDLIIVFGVVSVLGGMALGSWWSMFVVPAGFVVGFWLIAALITLQGESERVTNGLWFQFLFVALNGAFGVLLAALGTTVTRLLGPGASQANE